MSKYDVSSICNALMDILVEAEESDITKLGLNKGIMHLVDDARQNEVKSHFETKNTTQELGGSSLNAIRTLASLGANTAFAGMVGHDGYGTHIENRMNELGIDAHLLHSENADTGTCFILITPDGERTMNTNLGASCLFDESLVPMEAIANSKVFHFCGYQWGSPEQIQAIEKAVQIARDNNVIVSFDVADPFVVEHNREAFVAMIDKADIVFANRDEAKLLYQSSPEAACDEITKTGAIAVIKLGAEGALIGKGDQRIKVEPVATKVVDTTAAGDMFAAGFLYGFYNDRSLEDCGKIAATLASDVISRIGGVVSKKALDQVKIG
ncbi:adenosine kinase [Pseudobacteriovorax antillogorgiicola]|uniref:Sugar or nucleoside kinase, ribokinase family n=1 Tax=Pseudobacteriovorax antillogorgiicola TaxID=1513793 RepID=A0A1Y6BS22_9BACT|nr:adenosine kinase [Pseudobacteriovorax antillogorgiicola]TCS53775.1 sugar/nucleoside kinase (ribokinase family) [Pseudobacteriovorax antillogorgiicola]SMF22408.1 Sugar or nucleoside kinase, ribokinase family [Pseudobacteriovorax antillogorgiicola]